MTKKFSIGPSAPAASSAVNVIIADRLIIATTIVVPCSAKPATMDNLAAIALRAVAVNMTELVSKAKVAKTANAPTIHTQGLEVRSR